MKKFILLLSFWLVLGCFSTPPPDTKHPSDVSFDECNQISERYIEMSKNTFNMLRSNHYMLRAIYWKINARRLQNETMDKTVKEFMKEFREHTRGTLEPKRGNHAR